MKFSGFKTAKNAAANACALIVVIVFFLFHLHFFQRFIDWDQFAYIGNVENQLAGYPIVFNPHHLHFELSGQLFHQMMSQAFPGSIAANLVFNLRLRSLLTACVGVFFLALFLRNVTGRFLWGILGALLVAATHGYLCYAAKIDTSIFPAAWLSIALWAVWRALSRDRLTLMEGILLGVILGAGVILHQYTAVVCVLACITLLLPRIPAAGKHPFAPFEVCDAEKKEKRPRKSRILFVLSAATVGLVIVIAAYFYAGKTYMNLPFGKDPTPAEARGLFRETTFQLWLFDYETVDKEESGWGLGLKDFYPPYPFRGATDAFLAQRKPVHYSRETEFDYNLEDLDSERSLVYNILAAFMFIVLAGSILFLPVLVRRYGRLYVLLLACLVFYSVFFTYWEPFYFEFWILPSILVIVCGVLVFNLVGEQLALGFSRIGLLPRMGHLVVVLAFMFCLAAFSFHNFRYYLIPFSHTRIIEAGGAMKRMAPERLERILSEPYYRRKNY